MQPCTRQRNRVVPPPQYRAPLLFKALEVHRIGDDELIGLAPGQSEITRLLG